PPTVFKRRLNIDVGSNPKFHLINRDEHEQYYIVFNGSNIQVVDLSGNQYSVSGAVEYVTSSNPRDDIRVVTVADYTFVVNRKVVVKGGSEKSHSGY
ncbi:phage nozzle protein, partial [Pantoea ananatis]